MNPRLSLLAALALAAAGCAAGSKPVAKEKAAPMFTHAAHKDVAACEDCHQGIAQATSLKQRHIPTTEKCKECHEDKTAPAPSAIEPHLTFSHADHLKKVNGDCTKCHVQLPEPNQDRIPVPPMASCTACHYHATEFAQARCQPCHVDLKRFPLRPVTAYAHQGDYRRTHGMMAQTSAATCMVCHDQTYCAECHGATTRPFKPDFQFPETVQADFIHRGDYVSRHQIDAASDPGSCRKCHGSGFCDSCHRANNLSQVSANPKDPHPQGWLAQHGREARLNIVRCAGCHDQGPRTICIGCHSVAGVRSGQAPSPHPPGFTSRHSPADWAGNSMCRICHTS